MNRTRPDNPINRQRGTVGLLSAALALLPAGGVTAELAAEPAPPIVDEPVPAPPEAPPAGPEREESVPPSLDELLGLDEDEGEEGAEDAARREQEEALRRELAEERLAGAFIAAIEKMAVSADLLDAGFETGLGTQRVQEEILARLDELIDEASQQSQSGSSSSSSQQQQQQRQQRDPGRQQQQQRTQSNQQRPAGDQSEGMPPPMQQDELNPLMDESRREWGALPERIREMLLQGRQEKFSSLYEQLTREYYRRLAEE